MDPYAMPSGQLQAITERPRYYARQLVTPAELNLEASYFMDRLRRHNRLLHGWGVICGAKVCPVVEAGGGVQPWKVRITPGHLIDPYGNEIGILAERVVDLRSAGVTATAEDPAGEMSDPWCSDVWTDRPAGKIYVAVKYHQGMARPVRVQPAGCSCDDTSCEYSRWCDGYQIGFLDQCPPSHNGDPPQPQGLPQPGGLPDCPPDPQDPWVVLAEVDVDENGQITRIDNCSCRRIIVSLAQLWTRCTSTPPNVTDVSIEPTPPPDPGGYLRGETDITMHVKGENIDPGATVHLGQGINPTVKPTASGDALTLGVEVLKSAQQGPRGLTITNPGCESQTISTSLTVSKAEVPAATESTASKRRRPSQPK